MEHNNRIYDKYGESHHGDISNRAAIERFGRSPEIEKFKKEIGKFYQPYMFRQFGPNKYEPNWEYLNRLSTDPKEWKIVNHDEILKCMQLTGERCNYGKDCCFIGVNDYKIQCELALKLKTIDDPPMKKNVTSWQGKWRN